MVVGNERRKRNYRDDSERIYQIRKNPRKRDRPDALPDGNVFCENRADYRQKHATCDYPEAVAFRRHKVASAARPQTYLRRLSAVGNQRYGIVEKRENPRRKPARQNAKPTPLGKTKAARRRKTRRRPRRRTCACRNTQDRGLQSPRKNPQATQSPQPPRNTLRRKSPRSRPQASKPSRPKTRACAGVFCILLQAPQEQSQALRPRRAAARFSTAQDTASTPRAKTPPPRTATQTNRATNCLFVFPLYNRHRK